MPFDEEFNDEELKEEVPEEIPVEIPEEAPEVPIEEPPAEIPEEPAAEEEEAAPAPSVSSPFERIRCPKCGNVDPRMLKQVDDKSKVLSFAMAGIPVYRKVTRCGKCGAVF
ncbi:MAG TPA: hypothetical protein VKK79_14285 [Candidatus Lokiarchaeia archaeon]|nr:hypothetical protein [Candidatus Lokiarchaeia archaeon]